MKHLFIPYELAVIAKEKGFNEPCLACYDSPTKISQNNADEGIDFNERVRNSTLVQCITAPLYQQIVDWFRDKHNLMIEIGLEDSNLFDYIIGNMITKKVIKRNYLESNNLHKTYYEALEKAIEEAFKLI